jgi:hypothetical protein
MIKKDLTDDIWDSAMYCSGGKKRKTKHIVSKAIKDGIKVFSNSYETPIDQEKLYVDYYAHLIEQGFTRNDVSGQSALGAALSIMEQDRAGLSKTFFAFHNENLLACLNFAKAGSEVYLRKLAHAGNMHGKSTGATYYAMMAAAEWAKSESFATFNITNVRLGMDEKVKKLRQYKTRFGGEVIPIYEFYSEP